MQRRYKLVFDRDKVGRLVDAQEFTNLSFDRDRFDEDLIEELQADCQRSVTVTEDEVILHHVYTERRLYPLDLYLRDGTGSARSGGRLRQCHQGSCLANIFPGDLFPKNFGVSRHGVVVFYDYDEPRAPVGGQLPQDAGESVVRGRDARSAMVPGRTQRCLPRGVPHLPAVTPGRRRGVRRGAPRDLPWSSGRR